MKLRKTSLEELDRYRKLISELTSLNFENMKNMKIDEKNNEISANDKFYSYILFKLLFLLDGQSKI